MADLVFNIAKGKHAYYATLPATADALIAVVLESAGLQDDSLLKDHDTLAAILAANTEQTAMGRKTLANVTVTVDDTNDRVDIDADDLTWTAAIGNPIGALVICYDPSVGTGTDAELIPLSKHDFTLTPNGSDIIAQVPAGGFLRAS